MTETTLPTPADLQREVRRLAFDRPKHVYVPPGGPGASCYYFREGEPDCIMGHALKALGITPDDLEGMDDGSDSITGVWNFLEDVGKVQGRVHGKLEYWLNSIQRAQDSGETWGAAVRGADENEPLPDELVVAYTPPEDSSV